MKMVDLLSQVSPSMFWYSEGVDTFIVSILSQTSPTKSPIYFPFFQCSWAIVRPINPVLPTFTTSFIHEGEGYTLLLCILLKLNKL